MKSRECIICYNICSNIKECSNCKTNVCNFCLYLYYKKGYNNCTVCKKFDLGKLYKVNESQTVKKLYNKEQNNNIYMIRNKLYNINYDIINNCYTVRRCNLNSSDVTSIYSFKSIAYKDLSYLSNPYFL